MNTFFVQHKKSLISLCALFVLTFFLYAKTLYLGFFSDDYHFLHIMSQTDSIWKFFLTNNVGGTSGGSYGPILDMLWGIQYGIFGMHAMWYHIVLLSVYALTTWFVYLFTYRISGHTSVAVWAAVLFLVLQNHSSSIAWIAVMPHVWATLFFVIGLYSYLSYVSEHRSWRYVVALLCMMLSLFTKETALMFPLVLILIEIMFVVPSIWRSIKRLSVFVLGTALYLLIRYSIVGYVAGYYAQSDVSFRLIPKLQMFVELLLSMGLTSPHRQRALQFLMEYWGVLVCGVALLIILFWIVPKAYKKILGFLIGSYVIMSVPFVNLMFDATSNSGERYGYLLSVFFVMIVVIWLFALSQKVSWGRHVFRIVLIFIILGSFLQVSFELDTWHRSAGVRTGIIDDIAAFDFEPDDYVIFVGMPDNIQGVELMRNAIREMIDLETSHGILAGDRIPLYIEPYIFENSFKQVTFEHEHNDYHLKSVRSWDHIFTGFPMFEHKSGTYEMQDFRHYDHSGTAIHMSLDTDFLDAQTGRVLLAYFDGQMMQLVTIKE